LIRRRELWKLANIFFLNAYDEKGILNMKLYTKEDGDRRVKELEEKIRNWCGEEALKKVL
jgi:hypothetical protein